MEAAHGSIISMGRRRSSLMQSGGEQQPVGSVGIGGGWQLAWQLDDRRNEGGFKRVYLREEGVPSSRQGSLVSLPGTDYPVAEGGEYIQAAGLVSQPALYSKELMDQHPVGPAMVHPSETASKGPSWAVLLEPGVKHALFVGVGIQLLQQVGFSLSSFTFHFLLQKGIKHALLSNLLISIYPHAVFWHKWSSLLHAPNSGTSRR